MIRSLFFRNFFILCTTLLVIEVPLALTARETTSYSNYNGGYSPYYSDYNYRQNNDYYGNSKPFYGSVQYSRNNYAGPYVSGDGYNGYGGRTVSEYNYPGSPGRQSTHFLGARSNLVQTNGYEQMDVNNYNSGNEYQRPYPNYYNKENYQNYYNKNYYTSGYGGRGPTVVENNIPGGAGRSSHHFLGSGANLVQNNGYDVPAYNQQQYYGNSRYSNYN